jgi:hypothetical protein
LDHDSSFLGTFDYRSQMRRRYSFDSVIFRWTGHHALPALDTQALINGFLPIWSGENGVYGARAKTCIAGSGTQFQVDIKSGQRPAFHGRTTFFSYMSFVFVSEVF